MIHGDKDRATSHLATKEFFERIASTDKELKIYEGYEHVMTKVSCRAGIKSFLVTQCLTPFAPTSIRSESTKRMTPNDKLSCKIGSDGCASERR